MAGRPLRIKVCGYPFQVEWHPRHGGRLHEDDDGYWNLGTTIVSEQKFVIRSDANMGPHQERDTVLHEILHAVIRMTGQDDRFKEGDKHPDEKFVYGVTAALLNVLRDNPHLVAYLTEELPGD